MRFVGDAVAATVGSMDLDARSDGGHASDEWSSMIPLPLSEDVAATSFFFCLPPNHPARLDCCGGAFFPGGIVINFA